MSLVTDFKNLRETAVTSGITALTAGLVTFGVMTSALASRTDQNNSKFSVETLKNIVVTSVPLITYAVLASRIKNWKLN